LIFSGEMSMEKVTNQEPDIVSTEEIIPATKSTTRRNIRQINAELLDSEDSDDDLPKYDL